jgi:hypothetical protein
MGDMDIVLHDEGNSFVQWAVDTRRALELCANIISDLRLVRSIADNRP